MRVLVPECGFEWEKFLHLNRSELFLSMGAADFFDLAVVLAAERAGDDGFRCGTLLIWEEAAEAWLRRIAAEQVISCGFSPKNTLTPASTESERIVITVQREIRRPDGGYVWPQDVSLPKKWSKLPLQQQVMLTGLHLLGAEE